MKPRYFRQRKDYTCGPVSLQMALWRLGVRTTRDELISACGTTPETGTTRRALIRAARSYGPDVMSRCGWTVSELRQAVKAGASVIVNFREPREEEGHYGLVSAVTASHVVLDDPWLGRGFRMKIAEFIRRWHGYHRTTSMRWAVAIRKA